MAATTADVTLAAAPDGSIAPMGSVAVTFKGDKLEQELAEELDSVNAECESHEKVAFVVVVREPWTMENGMLTPTMKIKRNVIEDFYNRKMDEWFEQKRKVIWEF